MVEYLENCVDRGWSLHEYTRGSGTEFVTRTPLLSCQRGNLDPLAMFVGAGCASHVNLSGPPELEVFETVNVTHTPNT
jgi:hypothetical protein